MGREIRRVPEGWEHPTKQNGGDQPMFDESYKEAAEEWLNNCNQWSRGEHEDQPASCKYYWEWAGTPPDEDYYREEFKTEPTHYQVYETVSEGTPTSPVFKDLIDLQAWLIKEGHSESAAENFTKSGYVPSGKFINGEFKFGIDCAE